MNASSIIGLLGILMTVGLGWFVYIRTGKVMRRINAVLIARMELPEYKQVLRLIDDIEKTGTKRGTIRQRPNGNWSIHWEPGEAIEHKM